MHIAYSKPATHTAHRQPFSTLSSTLLGSIASITCSRLSVCIGLRHHSTTIFDRHANELGRYLFNMLLCSGRMLCTLMQFKMLSLLSFACLLVSAFFKSLSGAASCRIGLARSDWYAGLQVVDIHLGAFAHDLCVRQACQLWG